MINRSLRVEPTEGRAVALRAGERFAVVVLEGCQVGDIFCFSATGPEEYLSARHTRAHLSKLFPEVGEDFVSNLRRPMLRLVADTSPGVHDMLIAACDPARYELLGVGQHPSCADNARRALASIGVEVADIPQPVNVFMATPVGADGSITWGPSPSRAGDRIEFEALGDVVIAVSACPQDIVPINGGHPSALRLDVETGDAGDRPRPERST